MFSVNNMLRKVYQSFLTMSIGENLGDISTLALPFGAVQADCTEPLRDQLDKPAIISKQNTPFCNRGQFLRFTGHFADTAYMLIVICAIGRDQFHVTYAAKPFYALLVTVHAH